MDKTKAAVEVIKAVFEVIRAHGADGIPEGELYAHLMPYGCTLEHLYAILGTLQAAGLVTVAGHVVRAQ